MMEIFGFEITKKNVKKTGSEVVAPSSDDGSTVISTLGAAAAYYGMTVDLEGVIKNENDLIRRYREVSQYGDCDSAIEDIVNESIIANSDESPVEIVLDDVKLSTSIKDKIREEHANILKLYRFNNKGHDIFRSWYVDGRLYYHILLDETNIKNGIQELRFVDPRKIRRIKNIKKGKNDKGVDVVKAIEEFYIYNDKGINENTSQGIKLSIDSVIYAPSGLIDQNSNSMLGYLHKAIKPVNQLKMIEDALVIYRVSRAPERRIFYIDVGNLPKLKAEQYVNDIMNKYRNKIVYDANTGEVRDDRKHLSMMEDFWMPRREGGKGTEITTLQGGQNLGQIEDIQYFQSKLYQCLNVPISRLQPNQQFSLGRSNEISRDEIKFNKFIERIRRKFSALFSEALRVQLIAKGIIRPDEWDLIVQDIRYDYQEDNHFAELKEAEILNNRIDSLNRIQPYVGTYYSINFVKRHVLKQSDEEIEAIEKEINGEKDQLAAMQGMQPGMGGQQTGEPQ
jgi:polyhydroxyalkanoate synthesis regulator phasin